MLNEVKHLARASARLSRATQDPLIAWVIRTAFGKSLRVDPPTEPALTRHKRGGRPTSLPAAPCVTKGNEGLGNDARLATASLPALRSLLLKAAFSGKRDRSMEFEHHLAGAGVERSVDLPISAGGRLVFSGREGAVVYSEAALYYVEPLLG